MRGQSCRALLSLCWESEREKVHYFPPNGGRSVNRNTGRNQWKVEKRESTAWFPSQRLLISALFHLSFHTHTLFQFQRAVLAEKSNPRVEITDRHPLSLSVSVGFWVVVGEASVRAGREERLYYFYSIPSFFSMLPQGKNNLPSFIFHLSLIPTHTHKNTHT